MGHQTNLKKEKNSPFRASIGVVQWCDLNLLANITPPPSPPDVREVTNNHIMSTRYATFRPNVNLGRICGLRKC